MRQVTHHACWILAGTAILAAAPAHAATLPVTSGLILHLDVDDVTTDGSGNVTSWNDQSGLGNHATQSDTTMQPTLESAVTPTGKDVLRFDSQADADPEHLIIAGNPTDFDVTAQTWFVVFRPQVETDNRRMWTHAYLDVSDAGLFTISSQAVGSITSTSTDPLDSGLGYRSLARTNTAGFNAASAGGGTPTLTNTTDFFVGTSYVDTTTDEVFAQVTAGDGTQASDSNTGATLGMSGHLQTLIGAQTGNDLIIDTNGWSGDLAAMVIYNRVLTAQELADMTEFLRQEYVGDVAPPLVGDLNEDGFVGIADLNIVLGDWNNGTGGAGPIVDPRADPSGDDFVGIEDLNEVLGNWNAGTPPPTAVPEPTALTLLGLGGMALLRRK